MAGLTIINQIKKDKITNKSLQQGLRTIKNKVNITGSISGLNKQKLVDKYDKLGYEYVKDKKKMRVNPTKVSVLKKYPAVINLK